MDGSLTRWRDPIPKDAPSPYEVKKVEQTVHSRARAALFGEDLDDMVDDTAGDNEKEPDVILDDNMDMDDDLEAVCWTMDLSWISGRARV
jgi:hypothetical protein